MSTSSHSIESNRESFQLSELLKAQALTWEAIDRISKAIRPGQTEEEATENADVIISELGFTKKWHRTYVRFGSNTLHPYGIVSTPGTVLKIDDIYFLDIGPLWNGTYEGDCGATFAVGSDPLHHKIAKDVKTVFEKCREYWIETQPKGPVLYQYASEQAKLLGWDLNMNVDGHRLGDFPHQVFFKGGLTEIDFTPAPNTWILEIQLRHPTLDFGAFYEDLL